MKKIAILIAAFMMTAPAFAQLVPGAGYVNTTFTNKSGGKTYKASHNGFYAGASINLDLASMEGLSLVPGAYLSMVTSTGSDDYVVLSTTSTFTEIDLNIPVYFKYMVGVANGAMVYLFAGPTVQYGISSKVNVKASTIIGGESSGDVDMYDPDDAGYNRLNVLVGGGVGMGFKKFSVNIGYDYGLMNIWRDMDDVTGNRANFHVGVSYSL